MKQKSAPARMSSQARKYTMYGIVLHFRGSSGSCCVKVYPIIASIVYSFTNFNGFAIKRLCGVRNYVKFTEAKNLNSLWNTLYMCIQSASQHRFLALYGVAVLKRQKASRFPYHFYIPSVVSVVAASMVWVWVLNRSYGILNKFLMAIGVPANSVPGGCTTPTGRSQRSS